MTVTAVTAGNVFDDGDDAGGGRIALDQFADVLLDGADLLAGGVVKHAEVLLGDRTARGLDLVGELGALLDQLGSQADEGAELVLHPVGRVPARQLGVALLAVAGEPAGIDRIALAERAA